MTVPAATTRIRAGNCRNGSFDALWDPVPDDRVLQTGEMIAGDTDTQSNL